jgi:hypothetical protein
VINAAVWTYIIRRSRWTGWRLILTVFFVFYGVGTLMPQIETAYFVTHLPPGMLPRLFVAGLILAAVFAPLAVLILGKAKHRESGPANDSWLKKPAAAWIVKLSLIVVTYVVLYFTFGYFIAWKNEPCDLITVETIPAALSRTSQTCYAMSPSSTFCKRCGLCCGRRSRFRSSG